MSWRNTEAKAANSTLEKRVLLFCILACLTLAAQRAAAVVIEKIEVANNEKTYDVYFDVVIIADAAKARAVLTDYRQWPRLSRSITDSRLLATHADGRQRVSVTFSECVLLIFCRSLRQVKDVQTSSGRESYKAELVPDQGDFASGKETWEILAESKTMTRLRYRATLVLASELPPVIGSWLLKRQLYQELVRTATGIEGLAAH